MGRKKQTQEEKDKGEVRGRPWPKGYCPNPTGRRGVDASVTKARRLSKERLMNAIEKVLPMPVEEVAKMSKAKGVRACDALIASVMMKGIMTGSSMHAQFFMSYTFGRPLEYDPNEEIDIENGAEKAKEVPKDILIALLQGLQNAKSASVPTVT